MSNHDKMSHVLTEDSVPRAHRGDQDQDQGSTALGTNLTESPSSVLPTKGLSTSSKVQNLEQATAIIETLQASEAELMRDRELAEIELRTSRKREQALRNQLAQVREQDPKSQMIREVLDYWLMRLGKAKQTKTPLDGARAGKVRARLNQGFSVSDLKQAVDGLAAKPFVGPRGRVGSGTKAQRFDDITIPLCDESSVERFKGYADRVAEEAAQVTEGSSSGEAGRVSPALLPAPPLRPSENETVQIALDEGSYPYQLTDRQQRAVDQRREHERLIGDQRPPIDRVIDALTATTGYFPRSTLSNPDSWMGKCPCHDDRTPSLRVNRNPDGQVLLYCMAGCNNDDIVHAIGLQWRDLWDGCENDLGCVEAPFREPEMPAHLVLAMMQLIENRDVPADLRREMVQRLEREGRSVERQAA